MYSKIYQSWIDNWILRLVLMLAFICCVSVTMLLFIYHISPYHTTPAYTTQYHITSQPHPPHCIYSHIPLQLQLQLQLQQSLLSSPSRPNKSLLLNFSYARNSLQYTQAAYVMVYIGNLHTFVGELHGLRGCPYSPCPTHKRGNCIRKAGLCIWQTSDVHRDRRQPREM